MHVPASYWPNTPRLPETLHAIIHVTRVLTLSVAAPVIKPKNLCGLFHVRRLESREFATQAHIHIHIPDENTYISEMS